MTVPDFQSIMLPLLRRAADGNDYRLGDMIDSLAADLQLSDQDRRELLPSGGQGKFANRVAWSRTYLKKAGLLEEAGRGRVRITERGRSALHQNVSRIDIKYLRQFPGFIEFHAGSKSTPLPLTVPDTDPEAGQTPAEQLESLYFQLREKLQQDILDRIKQCSPAFFERLVVDLLVRMGYGGSRKDAGQAVGQSGDGGIDGIIKEDRLGLDVVYIQAKRWDGTVGRPVVQAFAGSLEGMRARKGVLITTSA